jgi:cation diffusion facilitator family transporter
MAGCDCKVEPGGGAQKRVLVSLLAINAAMFITEIVCGVVADSTGLIADSLDMLADALVYGISLYAVGRESSVKVRAARLSGVFQITLAAGVLVDVARRWLYGSEPESGFMLAVGGVALAANLTCLKLISKHREGEVHMRASWIFSKNDVLANLGVIIAGISVRFSGSRWPDLMIGFLIAALVFRGGVAILKDARAALPVLE